jgi:hypothetical protein
MQMRADTGGGALSVVYAGVCAFCALLRVHSSLAAPPLQLPS